MEEHAPRDTFSNSIAGILWLNDIFSTRKQRLTGEPFAVERLPGTGTVIPVNRKPEGAPVRAPAFYSAPMKIWLGKSSADAQLEKALLGQAVATPGGGSYNN